MRISSALPLVILVLATALAGCVAPPAEREAPPPPVAAAPPPPPPAPRAADWRDWPVTPGTWRYERDARGARALYGTPSGEARLVLRCELPARRVFLSRAGAVATPLTVRTTSIARALPVQPTGGMPYVAAELPVRDALLDAMAFSRGRFAIEQAGVAPLVVPSWAEIGRVIEDCRG